MEMNEWSHCFSSWSYSKDKDLTKSLDEGQGCDYIRQNKQKEDFMVLNAMTKLSNGTLIFLCNLFFFFDEIKKTTTTTYSCSNNPSKGNEIRTCWWRIDEMSSVNFIDVKDGFFFFSAWWRFLNEIEEDIVCHFNLSEDFTDNNNNNDENFMVYLIKCFVSFLLLFNDRISRFLSMVIHFLWTIAFLSLRQVFSFVYIERFRLCWKKKLSLIEQETGNVKIVSNDLEQWPILSLYFVYIYFRWFVIWVCMNEEMIRRSNIVIVNNEGSKWRVIWAMKKKKSGSRVFSYVERCLFFFFKVYQIDVWILFKYPTHVCIDRKFHRREYMSIEHWPFLLCRFNWTFDGIENFSTTLFLSWTFEIPWDEEEISMGDIITRYSHHDFQWLFHG